MKSENQLVLEQKQKLIVTTELKQAFLILQMPAIELAAYLKEEVLNNPVLEIVENEDRIDEEDYISPDQKEEKEEWLEEYLHFSDEYLEKGPVKDKLTEYSYENYITKIPDLKEELRLQLYCMTESKPERRIGEFLIENIDQNGYLSLTLKEAAQLLKVAEDEVEKVLKIIQTFDPPGVGARNLKECLLLQLDALGEASFLAKTIICDFLDEVAERQYNKIATKLYLPEEEIKDAVTLIRSLNPRPGLKYGGDAYTSYIATDVIFEKEKDKYLVFINDSILPRLYINPVYRCLLSSSACDAQTKKFIEDKINSAFWMLKNVEKRRLTLYRVAECLAQVQKDFLDKGVNYLRKLTLKEVAQVLNVHESTVSRAIANKYAATPQGIVSLKRFFASGVKTESGTVSQAFVKKKMAELIAAEDKDHPLSDQEIADLLSLSGFTVSRRTITKYRKELGLTSARGRKK